MKTILFFLMVFLVGCSSPPPPTEYPKNSKITLINIDEIYHGEI